MNDDVSKTLNSCVGQIVLFLASLVLGSILRGWVFTLLWGWFVVPTFRLPALSIPAAIALALVVRYLTNQFVDVESPKRSGAEKMGHWVALETLPLWSLAAGWVVHLFMAAS